MQVERSLSSPGNALGGICCGTKGTKLKFRMGLGHWDSPENEAVSFLMKVLGGICCGTDGSMLKIATVSMFRVQGLLCSKPCTLKPCQSSAEFLSVPAESSHCLHQRMGLSELKQDLKFAPTPHLILLAGSYLGTFRSRLEHVHDPLFLIRTALFRGRKLSIPTVVYGGRTPTSSIETRVYPAFFRAASGDVASPSVSFAGPPSLVHAPITFTSSVCVLRPRLPSVSSRC